LRRIEPGATSLRKTNLSPFPLSVGFAPLAARGARCLVLGSLPGRASLTAGQYYAQPRNAFWRIAGDVLGFDSHAPYARRVAALARAGVAVWDVCQAAHRPGSLDADIDLASVIANDFPAFFLRYPQIERIGLNGGTASRLFERLVVPTLDAQWSDVERIRLPSTSPAHAGMSFELKRQAWTGFLERAAPALSKERTRT
jgi:double-stranded uracil-DNA glycosylase